MLSRVARRLPVARTGLRLACLLAVSCDDSRPPVYPPDATELVALDQGDGYWATLCSGRVTSYTLRVAAQELEWHVCVEKTGQVRDGKRILTDDEMNKVEAAAEALEISSRIQCGADRATLVVRVTSPAGTRDYVDDFHVCDRKGTYITGVLDLFAALFPLAQP